MALAASCRVSRWADFGALDRNHASRPKQIEIKRDAVCHRETPGLAQPRQFLGVAGQ
jgi:hypothetical protein